MLLILLGVGSAAHAQYDFDKLNDGKPSVTKKPVEGTGKESEDSLERHRNKFREEADARRLREYEDNQRAASRSGDFQISYDSPKTDKYRSTWQATCKEGGGAWVSISHDSPNIYSWGATGYAGAKGGADAGIGVDAALRKACRGGH